MGKVLGALFLNTVYNTDRYSVLAYTMQSVLECISNKQFSIYN